MQKIVYFDNNATTPLHPEVKKTMRQALDMYGNPSSMHTLGRKAREQVEQARTNVAQFINAESQEIIFTSGGTEAANTILSMFNQEIITSSIEHPCVLEMGQHLQQQGTTVHFLKVDQYGKVDIAELKKTINDKTELVAVMLANNEIGTIQDIKTIATIAHQHGALCYTDAVQAVGKLPVDVKELDVDFLSLSAHKIYGPKGIGALYIKAKTKFAPLLHGGHQEQQKRPGTENTIGIIGLGKAIEMRQQEMLTEEKRLKQLKQILKQGIEATIPDIRFNDHPTDAIANTINVSFAGAEGESILLYLDLENIAVSTGSACASGSLDPSHVLMATGIPVEYAHGSLRISLGRENTRQDIEYMLNILPKVIKKVRDMSTLYRSKT